MHVLALTQNDIAAPKYGGALRVAFLLNQLIEQGHHASVVRFRHAGAPASRSSDRIVVHDLVIPRGYDLAPVAALTHLLSRAAERIARDIHRERRIDLVQSDPPWAALSGVRLARDLNVPHVLLSQNCESTLAAEFAKTGPAQRLPLVGRYVADFNVGVVRWAERRAVVSSRLTLTPSPRDREEMVSVGIPSHGVEILPNGTGVRQPAPRGRAAMRDLLGLAPDAPTVIFVGRMDYPPNLEAVRLICSQVAPGCPEVAFLLVGLNPPRIPTPDNVRMIGPVDAVEGYLGASDLAIVPILQGSGTRIKILDAWAAGLPVLATSAGASGLDFQDGSNLVIEDDIGRFPERIRELLGDRARLAGLRRGALAAAIPYRWDAIGRRYVESLRSLVGEV